MKILFMGTMEYSLEVLESISKKHEIVAVCTKRDLVIGRKKEVVFPPVKLWAIKNDVPVYQKEKMRLDFDDLMELDFDFIVTASFGDFVPKKLLEKCKVMALNAHASLLPKYRGGSPIQTAIKNGDEYTGVTIMQMVSKMDAGAIITQEKIKIEFDDTSDSMFKKLASLAAKLMCEVLDDFNSYNLTEQNEDEVTFSPNIKPDEECINFNSSSKDIYNHVRAFYSFPGTYSYINENKVKIFKVQVVEINSTAKPGTVLRIDKSGILVKTLDFAILILDIQISGKKRMTVNEFINGNKLIYENNVFTNTLEEKKNER